MEKKSYPRWTVPAGILAGLVCFIIAALYASGFDPETFGLGQNTIARVAYNGGLPVNAIGTVTDSMLMRFRECRQTRRPVVLWLGASQLHALNRYRTGDRLAVEYADGQAAERTGPAYVQVSSPNASLYDLLAMYLRIRQEDLVPDMLIIAMVYDDLREENVQPDLLNGLAVPGNTTVAADPGLAFLTRAVRDHRKIESDAATTSPGATQGTPQAKLETYLTRLLENHLPGYRHRGRLYAHLEIMVRMTLLKTVIAARGLPTVPEVPEGLKTRNMQALRALFVLAREDSVQVLLYKQPHRPDETPFYHDRLKYDAFFSRLAKECTDWPHVRYADLETLVPAVYWGTTNAGTPDHFHFTDDGHRRLGTAVDSLVALMQEEPHAFQ